MIGFAADEIALDEPTRSARLKWAVVVDAALPPGRAANAAICVAAATSAAVDGLLGPDAEGPDGSPHPGLPWAGCTVLAGTAEQLVDLRRRAAERDDVFVADMPAAAQATRVYADYLQQVRVDGGGDCLAVSLVGPRNRVDRLTKGLSLLP